MAHRASRPAPKSAGRARMTTIRDILREMEDEAKSEEEETQQDQQDKASETEFSSGVSVKSEDGRRKIVVRVPSASTTQTHRRKSNHHVELIKNESVGSSSSHGAQRGATSRKSSIVGDGRDVLLANAKSRSMSNCGVSLISEVETLSVKNGNIHSTEQVKNNYMISDVEDRESIVSEDSASGCGIWADIDGVDSMKFLPKLLIERGSAPFHSVMDKMKEEIKKKRQKREGLKKAIRMSMMFKSIGEAKSRGTKQEVDDSSSGSDINDDEDDVIKPKSFSSMSRGWKMINMKLKEEQLEKKKLEQTGGWTMLSKAITQMTNEEKARQELYEKYLHHPDSWVEGLKTCPKFLEDMKSSNKRDGQKARPHTANVQHPKVTRNGYVHGTCAGQNSLQKTQDTPNKNLRRRPNSGYV